MNGALRYPFRVGARLIWLFSELLLAAISFGPRVRFRSGCPGLKARSFWLHVGCKRVLRVLNIQIHAAGPIPTHGLLVSNHLSYLDILLLSAVTPSLFIAKREVQNWPVFGWFAQLAGTLFANRECRIQVGQLSSEVRTALDQGALVVLFPEGTSSNGRTVLPFKSALLEPATNSSYPLWTSSIHYELWDGDVGEEVCYWKEMTLVPHLLNLMSKRHIKAAVRFSESRTRAPDRKQAAWQLHGEVLRLMALVRTDSTGLDWRGSCLRT